MLRQFIGRLLRLSPDEATFARRGFETPRAAARERLERAGGAFVTGYNAAMTAKNESQMLDQLEELEKLYRGFAYEGAAMALALFDALLPMGRGRLERFAAGPGDHHVYMVYVGAGWAAARLRRQPEKLMRRLDTVMQWLVMDGYGFHEGYFHPRANVYEAKPPTRFSGYMLRAFDQGLGRCLWFVYGADAERVSEAVGRFAASRRNDLWSGVGLACAYAGGTEVESIVRLRELAGEFAPQLAQGASFAAKARQRAGLEAEHTERACEVLCGTTASEAAAVTDRVLAGLPARGDGVEPFEVWRQRIAEYFSEPRETCGLCGSGATGADRASTRMAPAESSRR